MDYWSNDPIMLLACLFFSGAIGAMIGARKHRALFGFVMSFLLGPIGWIVAACAADCGPKCPECGGVVNKGARRCCHCGAELGVASASLPQPGRKIRVKARRNPIPAAPDTITCPHCGGVCTPPGTPGTYACPHCGKGIAFT